MDCPEESICFTEEEWSDFLLEYEVDIINEVGLPTNAPMGDAEAASNFIWEVLFLTPVELFYIGISMTVLATYGLSIYYVYKWIQKKFSLIR